MVLLVPSTRTSPACPICGAENYSCGGAESRKTPVERDTDYEVRSDGTVVVDKRYAHRLAESRWVSAREELVRVKDGKFERHYAVGDPVPLLVALSQGQVRSKQLMDDDKAEIKRHVEAGDITFDQVRESLTSARKKKRGKDRMVREDQVVTK